MPAPKLAKSSDGRDMHYSVGAVIKKEDKFLLIDRKVEPLGFACVAGHIDEEDNKISALKKEVEEESGLQIESCQQLFEEEVSWNTCSKGIGVHYWYVFQCEVSGALKRSERETKSIGWYSIEEMKTLALEPVWEYWFKKMGLL